MASNWLIRVEVIVCYMSAFIVEWSKRTDGHDRSQFNGFKSPRDVVAVCIEAAGGDARVSADESVLDDLCE